MNTEISTQAREAAEKIAIEVAERLVELPSMNSVKFQKQTKITDAQRFIQSALDQARAADQKVIEAADKLAKAANDASGYIGSNDWMGNGLRVAIGEYEQARKEKP